MTLLSPLALLWVLSVPVLLWLWRLASTHRQLRVSSLVPFEHLLRRAHRRRTRLMVNALFWLQLAALIGGALALAQPALVGHRAKTILAILDTSASMGARRGGSTAFEQAQRALTRRLARKAPMDQVFLMTTAPVTTLTPQPTSDGASLARAIDAQRVHHLGGNLATTERLGRSLLGRAPDETLIVTDEPQPSEIPTGVIQWITVGRPVPNIAIVGLDAMGPLCSSADARVVATIQNFSTQRSSVKLTAKQAGHRLAETTAEVPSHARQSLALALPEGVTGQVELALAAPADALAADNRAWVNIHPTARRPVVVRSARPQLTQAVSAWLNACQTLTWTAEATAPLDQRLVITDQEETIAALATPAMVFRPSPAARLVRSYWVVSPDHPIGSYLAPVDVVATPLNLSADAAVGGTPVVSALVNGRQVPVVVAQERNGQRTVWMRFDPAGQAVSTPILLAFFNSLRWLMGDARPQATGDPLMVAGWATGPVMVHRPDGTAERLEARGGAVRYEGATLAGLYRFRQGSSEVTEAVNFFDPLESNTMDRVTTWHAPQAAPPTSASLRRSLSPLASFVMLLLLALLLVEWWRYAAKGRSTSPLLR